MATPDHIRVGIDGRNHRLADVEMGQVGFLEIGLDPDMLCANQAQNRLARSNELARL